MQDLLGFYASIGVFTAIAQLAYLFVAFVVGGTLFVRGRRSGEWTQWLLGLHLILSMGVGYLLTCAGTVAVEYHAPVTPTQVGWILAFGYGASSAGLTTTLHFTRRVFRSGKGLPFAYSFASGAAIWTGWLGYVVSGDVTHGRFEGMWYWVMTMGMLACNVWVAFEPCAYYTRLRKRVRLGLAEPLVAERMLLWGIGSLARASLVCAGPLANAYMAGEDEATHRAVGAAVLVTTSFLGLVISGSYWLALQPPRAYLRWVERRAARLRA